MAFVLVQHLAPDHKSILSELICSYTRMPVYEIQMVMAQNPASTEFEGMPRSALDTGLVDCELTPAEMPAQLIKYTKNEHGNNAPDTAATSIRIEGAMKDIFGLLRSKTGHDFSRYKLSTLQRRIERRRVVHHIEVIDDYVKFLRQSSVEVEALFSDMLIRVTSFFRDPDAFNALERQVIPSLFKNKFQDGVIRVWTTGCSTGEEAYSIALQPDGWLFLGTSKSVGDFDRLFTLIDRNAKLFRRNEDLHVQRRTALGSYISPVTERDRPLGSSFRRTISNLPGRQPKSLREITEHALLSHVVAAGALVNALGSGTFIASVVHGE